jgi:hypothetical protein
MKQDRFLVGILIGIGALVVLALALFFIRQEKDEYVADNTPEGVVHDYALAVFRGDYEKAYAYLAEAERRPSYSAFRQAFFNRSVDPNNAGLEIGETEINGDEAIVTIVVIYKPGDPFSSGYRGNEVARLERQDGNWKLLQMPYNFWAYDWYQPTPKPMN